VAHQSPGLPLDLAELPFAISLGLWNYPTPQPTRDFGFPGSRGGKHYQIMSAIAQDPNVLQKTQELCNAILNQPAMKSMRQNIDAFMGDELARAQYDAVMHKGRALHEKQHQALPLSDEEIADFEKSRDTLIGNPVAKNFIEAQEELHGLRDSIQDFVSKTIELGRMPKPEDFESGCCGGQGGGGGGCCNDEHGHDHGHDHGHGHSHGGGGCCSH
jgi:cell fate (sporulation/competence/biofilm development) regulator YlbF (YheA/YmcA/DUF963 family)